MCGALNGVETEPAWKTKPSWHLVATDDHMIPPDAQLIARGVGCECSGRQVERRRLQVRCERFKRVRTYTSLWRTHPKAIHPTLTFR